MSAAEAVRIEERPQLTRNIEAYLRNVKARQDDMEALLEQRRARIGELEKQVLALCRAGDAGLTCPDCGFHFGRVGR